MFTKNKILFCVIAIIFFARAVFGTDTRYYIQTPRSSDVPDTYQTDEMPVGDRAGWDNYFATNYPNATQIKLPGEQYSTSRTFNCHGYAWHYVEESERVWIGYYYAGSEEIYFEEPTGDGSYDEVSESVCTKISYSGNHSAIYSGTANYYYSKWGAMPLMYHHKDYHPGYGTSNQFFRRSVDVPEDQSTIASALSAAVSGQTVHVSGIQGLTSNIYVQSGITLKLVSGSTLNLNGYYVKSTGGTIVVEASATINGYTARITQSGQIKGYYSTFAQALSNVTSGQTIELYNTVNLTGVASIGSGITLIVKSGATINFGSYYIISTGGTITVENGVTNYVCLKNGGTTRGLFPTVNSALSVAQSGETIEVVGTSSITSSFELPSSYTILLKQNATLNMNGYNIVLTGGTVNFESGSSLGGLKAYLKYNSTLKGYYGTISFAINSTGTNS